MVGIFKVSKQGQEFKAMPTLSAPLGCSLSWDYISDCKRGRNLCFCVEIGKGFPDILSSPVEILKDREP